MVKELQTRVSKEITPLTDGISVKRVEPHRPVSLVAPRIVAARDREIKPRGAGAAAKSMGVAFD